LSLVEAGGGGPPILLLHGLMGSARTWADQLPWLRRLGRVYGYDAPGHGDAGPVPRPPATEAFVADIARATEPIDEPMVVVGHSMGALHGWVFAAQHPQRVRALVVEDMAPDFRGRTAAGWAALIEAWPQPFPDDAAVLEYFGPIAGRYFMAALRRDPDGYRLPAPVTAYRAISEEWGTRHFWDEWAAVPCPALLLEAEHGIAPAGQMAQMAHRHDTVYQRIPGAGHLIHDQFPDVYRRAVEQFLRRHGLAAALAYESEAAVGGLLDQAVDQQRVQGAGTLYGIDGPGEV
jgi:pimeloyl-ACP methyl ester carboxylesterase